MNEKIVISICMGSSCYARGNKELVEKLKEYLVVEGLEEQVKLKGALCCDLCGRGPIALVNGEQVLTTNGQLFDSIKKIISEKIK